MRESPPALDALPLFPLGTVLFPGGLLPLRIFEARYMDMARSALKTGAPFGVCLIREGREAGAPATPEPVGTLAYIVEADMEQLGLLKIKARGAGGFRILESSASAQGLLRARIELLDEEPDVPLAPLYAPCAKLLRAVAEDTSQRVFLEPYAFDSTSWVGRRLAEILPIPASAKQKLLELDDAEARLDVLFRYLRERGVLREQ